MAAEVSYLRQLRDILGMSQQRAADSVGVSRALWDKWERRERPMDVAQLIALKKGLGLDQEAVVRLLCWWALPEGVPERCITTRESLEVTQLMRIAKEMELDTNWIVEFLERRGASINQAQISS